MKRAIMYLLAVIGIGALFLVGIKLQAAALCKIAGLCP